MMTKTQLLDARRNIRKEIVAYLSIVIIGLLATLSYLSVTYSAATLKKDALDYFNAYGLWDLEVTSTLLMEDEDLEAIRALPSVAAAERVWQIDAKLHAQDGDISVLVNSLPGQISRPKLLEGSLPAAATECAVEKELMDRCGLSLGQRISLDSSAVSGVDPLLEKSFVITGVFLTPDHITFMTSVTPTILVPEESFNREGLGGAFMRARVRIEGAPADRYGDAYWRAVQPVQDAVEALAKERAPLRYAKLHGELQAQIDEGQAQLDEGRAQLDEAEKKLLDSRDELDRAAEFLSSVRDRLDAGAEQLRESKKLIGEYRRLIRELRDGGVEWADKNLSPSSLPEWFPLSFDALMTLLENKSYELIDQSCDIAEKKLFAYSAQVYAAERDWYYAGEEYLDALTRYDKARKQLEEGERQFAEGQAEWEEGKRRLVEARDSLNRLGECRWVVLNDRGNPGFVYAEANSEKLSSLSMSFSSIFLVVGALVIYATIGRMVEQQRTLIGASKALGLYKREVFAKYLYFACTATMLGVMLGVLLAWLPLQRVVLQSYEKLMTYGDGTRSFLPLETGLVVIGAFAISFLAVYLGCAKLLRLPAIQLMQGSAQSSGRKRTCRSVQRNLYAHLILRNMRTDWRRVLVTTVSIAGGCMLMVIGFTLRYGISGVPDRQFGGIQTYEAEVFFDSDTDAAAVGEIEARLDRNALPHIAVSKLSSVYEVDGTINALTMIVAGKGELADYFTLRDVQSGAVLELPDSGVLIPRRFSEYYGLGEGDSVRVYDAGMNLRELRIAGVFENYYGQLFFMTPEGCSEIYGAAPKENCFFVKTGGLSLDLLQQQLADIQGVTKVSDAAAERNVIEQFSAALGFVVWLMLLIAAVMACFIVANFTVTYLQRKTAELTLMRVSGFRVRECVLYAAADLVVTTILGTVLGLILGGFVGQAILRTTETPYIQMIRDPAVQSYLFSALITCGFSALTNICALRRIKDLKLSDISS